MKNKLFIFILGAILISEPIVAQEELFSVHIQGLFSLPNGAFSNISDFDTKMTKRSGIKVGDNIGLAKKGFGIGAELSTHVWFDGLNWVFSSKILFNEADGSEVQSLLSSNWGGDSVNVEVDMGTWLNIPLMTGFRYDYELSNSFTFYGTLQGGVSFTKAPSLKASIANDMLEETDYDLDNVFGFEIGTGIIFNNKYNISFRYLDFGTARYNGTRKVNRNYLPTVVLKEDKITGEERRISMFLITLGVML